jgi:hypothetical protein
LAFSDSFCALSSSCRFTCRLILPCAISEYAARCVWISSSLSCRGVSLVAPSSAKDGWLGLRAGGEAPEGAPVPMSICWTERGPWLGCLLSDRSACVAGNGCLGGESGARASGGRLGTGGGEGAPAPSGCSGARGLSTVPGGGSGARGCCRGSGTFDSVGNRPPDCMAFATLQRGPGK